MELADLTADEATALVGLLREIVQADHDYSTAEEGAVQGIRTELGRERFDAAIDDVRERFPHRHDLKEHVKTISRPEARKLIYDRLFQVAEADGLDSSEEKPLKWLASWWEL